MQLLGESRLAKMVDFAEIYVKWTPLSAEMREQSERESTRTYLKWGSHEDRIFNGSVRLGAVHLLSKCYIVLLSHQQTYLQFVPILKRYVPQYHDGTIIRCLMELLIVVVVVVVVFISAHEAITFGPESGVFASRPIRLLGSVGTYHRRRIPWQQTL